jgi:hypothetical protein
MWIRGPSGPTTSPVAIEKQSPSTLATSDRIETTAGRLMPLSSAMMAGRPSPERVCH